MSGESKLVIIVDDRLWRSVGRDVVSIGGLIVAVGIGVLIDSSALQWIAGLGWVAAILGRVMGSASNKYTISAAREKLDELEQAA